MADALNMLVTFKERGDAGEVTFVDELPPFGVVQIAETAWEQLGEPRELLVSLMTVGPNSDVPCNHAEDGSNDAL